MEGADFFVEDLLDLSNGGDDMMTDAYLNSIAANSTDSPALTPVSDSCNSSGSGGNLFACPDSSHFSSELCVSSDELEELEWLSNFVEESFSTEELHKYQYQFNPALVGQGQFQTRQPNTNPNTNVQQPAPVPGKARSRRSRVAPCDWSTRLLMVSNGNSSPATSSSSSDQNPGMISGFGPKKATKRRESGSNNENLNGEVRRCLHCAAEKTPQWRTGPMGPKTLCNACGVRYKSGRLVPEYRPAASPTFISTKHSNSHRKVMELRRQKDVQRHQPQQFMGHHHHHPSMLMGVSNGGDNYLIPHHMGHDYRQMI